MAHTLKYLARALTPPLILNFLKKPRAYGFFGNYATWSDAVLASGGYDTPEILEKVMRASQAVQNGEAAYERDSVTFKEKEYVWPLLAALLWIASENDTRLNILDFGGSLGSTYFQHRTFLKNLKEIRWSVVEQPHFVTNGKKYFEDDHLRFFGSIDECIRATKPHTILLSSVLQYLEKPYAFLEEILRRDFTYVLFDRTFFLKNTDRLTVQKVPPRIYTASYPAWFLNKERCMSILSRGYEVVATFPSLGGTLELDGTTAFEEGLIFKKNRNR